jgi:lipid A 3-O-deacylase
MISMHNKKWIWFIIVINLSIGKVYASNGISLSYGNGVTGLKSLRIGVQQLWDEAWCKEHLRVLQGYWELSAYHMHRTNQDDLYNNKLTVLSFSPVFRLYKPDLILQNKNIYVEFAIGVAQLSKRTLGARELGTNFQFEDRLGFGLQFGKNKQYDIGYRVFHFSNAYIGHKNHGINLQMLYFNYWFGK